MWRPENWVNKDRDFMISLGERHDEIQPAHTLAYEVFQRADAFEAGADAMLKAVLKSMLKLHYLPDDKYVVEMKLLYLLLDKKMD